MNKQFGNEDPKLAAYVAGVFCPSDPLYDDVLARQAAAGMPDIQVARLDGVHLGVLARLVAGASPRPRAVEIGTLGGWSGTCLLRGLGEAAELDTFELDEKHATVARETFRRAGLEARARVHVGRAADRLGDIEPRGPFDLVFIDADKDSYPLYLAWAAKHLRVGGAVIGDNAFLFGQVGDAAEGPEAKRIRAMQQFNEALARGGRFQATMFPTGEGLAVGVKVR